MNQLLRKSISIMAAIIVFLTCFYHNTKEVYADNSNQYLVLVQQKNGSWKAYDNMIEISENHNLMIRAKKISKALGFTYKNTSKTFVIKRSSAKNNTYDKEERNYTYTNQAVRTKKSAANIAYTSKASNYNLCQVNTLSTLVNYKYFSSNNTEYDKSYKGIICYSKYQKIPATVPEVKLTPTKKPTPTPIPEPATILVEGVEFPVRTNFLSASGALSDWGGAAPIWRELKKEVDGKIVESTNLIIGSDTIEFTHLVAGSDGVCLAKSGKGYKLSISVQLSGSVLKNQNAEIVKAMVATISSEPFLVYTAIFESFSTGETHGINEDKYVTVGDCKIKVEIKSGVVSYLIKEA